MQTKDGHQSMQDILHKQKHARHTILHSQRQILSTRRRKQSMLPNHPVGSSNLTKAHSQDEDVDRPSLFAVPTQPTKEATYLVDQCRSQRAKDELNSICMHDCSCLRLEGQCNLV